MSLVNISTITTLQKSRTSEWQDQEIVLQEEGLHRFVEDNHRHNFLLWNEEDKARRDDMGPEYVYHAKRNIDQHNQKRNNCMEQIDEWITHHLQPKTSDCPIHSETPGMMIDRLSILALKEYHMRKQTLRSDTDEQHITLCQQKLEVIIAQREQLAQCLSEFISEIEQGSRTFRVYHQFKMYNDPTLNPQLYGNKPSTAGTPV